LLHPNYLGAAGANAQASSTSTSAGGQRWPRLRAASDGGQRPRAAGSRKQQAAAGSGSTLQVAAAGAGKAEAAGARQGRTALMVVGRQDCGCGDS